MLIGLSMHLTTLSHIAVSVQDHVSGPYCCDLCCFREVPDRLAGVPVDLLKKQCGSVKCPLFLHLKSNYFKPGSLRQSPGDLREHFLKIWCPAGIPGSSLCAALEIIIICLISGGCPVRAFLMIFVVDIRWMSGGHKRNA